MLHTPTRPSANSAALHRSHSYRNRRVSRTGVEQGRGFNRGDLRTGAWASGHVVCAKSSVAGGLISSIPWPCMRGPILDLRLGAGRTRDPVGCCTCVKVCMANLHHVYLTALAQQACCSQVYDVPAASHSISHERCTRCPRSQAYNGTRNFRLQGAALQPCTESDCD
jgi:hypothetical protein